MATTKIWKVKSNIKKVIEYITNEVKTENKSLVTGINCLENIADVEMMNTKKRFFKDEGVLCYHAYQSFKEGEVSKFKAHEIGIKLAKELWGDKFEVIVTTHTNTKNIHNHFAFNSVSFLDGKRFNNTKKDYSIMRNTSDRICNEYRLGTIQKSSEYLKYGNYKVYKMQMKDSIDYAIKVSKNYDECLDILKDLGYIVTDKDNKLVIRRLPYKRNLRIQRQFGQSYSKDNIFKRIIETGFDNKEMLVPNLYVTKVYNQYNKIMYNNYPKKGSLMYLYLYYAKLLRIDTRSGLNDNITKMTPELIREIKLLDDYSNQANYIVNNKIESIADLKQVKEDKYIELNDLKCKRGNLWEQYKKVKTSDEKNVITSEIASVSSLVNHIQKELELCKKIEIRSLEIEEKMRARETKKEKGISR